MKKIIFSILLLAFSFSLTAQNTVYPGLLTESSDNTLTYTTVTLGVDSVGALGTAKTLLSAPGAGKVILILNIALELKVSLTEGALEVGTQNLFCYIGTENTQFRFNNSNLESATDIYVLSVEMTDSNTQVNTALTAKLESSTNPASGSATMTFHIFYKIVDVNI